MSLHWQWVHIGQSLAELQISGLYVGPTTRRCCVQSGHILPYCIFYKCGLHRWLRSLKKNILRQRGVWAVGSPDDPPPALQRRAVVPPPRTTHRSMQCCGREAGWPEAVRCFCTLGVIGRCNDAEHDVTRSCWSRRPVPRGQKDADREIYSLSTRHGRCSITSVDNETKLSDRKILNFTKDARSY